MLRRMSAPTALLGALALAACGPSQAVVTAEIDMANPEGEGTVVRPLADLEIQFLPYDRDAIFDSLAAAFGTPEPEIPQDLLEAQSRLAGLQEEWRDAETEWNNGRSRLQEINSELQGMSRGEARYRLLFREFEDQERVVRNAEGIKDGAFQRFTALQDSLVVQTQTIRAQRDGWGDEAFADFGDVALAKARASGRQPAADTTDANGVAGPVDLKAGAWWVHARYPLAFEELYWNVPVAVEGKEPVPVRLTRENAQVRPKL